MSYGDWPAYVPAAERRKNAAAKMQKLKQKGLNVQPIEIQGRKIAKSFWGIAWNDHLESFADFANRIPRGKTYVRNGSVCHLDIGTGKVEARVSGSSIYQVNIEIKPLAQKKWDLVKDNCAGQVGSMLELLQGKLSSSVMSVVTNQKTGLFPTPKEIDFNCDCPDGAYMCKHIAAVLYGVGARLDDSPELLFKLRAVDHQELISADVAMAKTTAKIGSKSRRIADESIANVFGIDISTDEIPEQKKKTAKKVVKKAAKKTAKKIVKKAIRKKVLRSLDVKGNGIFTSQDVIKLRRKFAMNEIEFSGLCGVSSLTIQNWESKSGALALRKLSRESLEKVEKFSKNKAWAELSKITGT